MFLQMKDTGVHRIVQNCPKLKSLALANCPSLTDTTMGEVATYCSSIRFAQIQHSDGLVPTERPHFKITCFVR